MTTTLLTLVVAGGAAAVGLVYGMRHPFRVVALYAGVVPFGSGLRLPLPLPEALSTASSLLGLFATACLAVQVFVDRRRSDRLLPSMPLWLALAGLMACTYLWSIDPSRTAQQALALAALVALFVCALLARADADDLRWFEAAVIAGGAATGLYAVAMLLSGRLTAATDAMPRFATAGGGAGAADPNITAASLLLPLMLALVWALSPKRSPLVRVAAAGAAAATTTGILLTGSRGGLIAAVAGALVLAGASRRTVSTLAVVAVVAAVGLAVTPHDVRARFTSGDSTGRQQVWQVGLRSCSRYCITGSGADTFPDVYGSTLFTNPDLEPHGIENYKAHNLWLALLVEEGVAGVVLALLAFVALFRDLRGVERPHRAGAVAALVALLVSNVFINNVAFKYFWLVLLYAGLVALVYGSDGVSGRVAQPLHRRVDALTHS